MGKREIVVLLAGVVVVNACGRKEPPEQPAPEPAYEAPAAAPAPAPSRPAPAAQPTDDGAAAALRTTLEERIHFAFNSADLSPTAQQTLAAKASALTTDPTIRLRIEGHADERGSDEYNLALGNRRASSAMRYMVQRGVPATRLETVSFGEERPLDRGDGESAWAQNRRDEFQVTAGVSSR